MYKRLVLSILGIATGVLTIYCNQEGVRFLELYKTGRDLYHASDYLAAINTLDSALSYYDSLEPAHNQKIITLYIVYGASSRRVGNFSQALHCYGKAENLAYRQGKSREYINKYIYYNQAITYIYIGEHTKAVLLLENVLKQIEDQKFILYVFHELGVTYYKKGDYKRSINFFEKIIHDSKNQIENLDYTLNQCAKAYGKLDQNEKALELLNRSLKIGERKYDEKPHEVAIIYKIMGNILGENLNDPEGLQYLKKALSIYHQSLPEDHYLTKECYSTIGDYFLHKDQPDSALHYYQRSLMPASSDYFQNPDLENRLVDQYYLDLLDNKSRALVIKSKQNDPVKHLLAADQTLQLALKAVNILKRSYQFEESKLHLGQKEREILEQNLAIVLRLYELTDKEKYKEQAFQYADRAKYTTLKAFLSDKQAKGHAHIPDSLLQQERSFQKQMSTCRNLIHHESQKQQPDTAMINHWQQQLFTASLEQENLVHYFEDQYPEYHTLKYNNDTSLTIASLRSRLTRNDAVMAYVLMDSVLIRFVVTLSDFEVSQVAVQGAFFTALQRVQDELSKPVVGETVKADYYRFVEDAHDLYQKLIAPHRSLIKGKNLHIIPDRKLSLLSFDVLLEEKPQLGVFNYLDLPYLIKQHPINYFYAARFMIRGPGQKSLKNSLAAFAPDYAHHPKLALLPQEEVQQLARYFNSTVYDKEQATESTFKQEAGQYDIFHLSMHAVGGQDEDRDPVRLVFGETDTVNGTDDGFLDAREIYHLPVHAKLVTLSACNTGSGTYVGGEGILSLARAFHFVDCEALITTLWPLNSGASEVVLPGFYKHLSRGHRKDVAMQKAKLAYLSGSANFSIEGHPANWSNMIVLGDPYAITYKRYGWWIGLGLVIIILILVFIRKFKR